MKKFRRILCVIISMAFIISMCGINAYAASSPKLNKTTATLLVGSTLNLKVTGTSSTVKWSTSDSKVCTVSKSGKVTAKGAGSAKIYAKVGKKKLSCNINVVKSYIKPITEVDMETGESKTLSMKSYNVKSVSVSSSDEDVLMIRGHSISKGTIKVKTKAISSGTSYIYVTDKNNKSASVKIKVNVTAPNQTLDYNDVSGHKTVKSESKAEEIGNYADQVLEIVNKERADAGLSPLTLDSTLCAAADVRAKEVGRFFDHTRPDGTSCFTILDEYNISYMTSGENIAKGTSSSKSVMNLWMNSSGHRANILNSAYTKIGVGYDSSTQSWVQLFIG